jgi:hypothetical protein
VIFCGKPYSTGRPFFGLFALQQVLLAVISGRDMALYSQTEAGLGESQNNSAGFGKLVLTW